MDIQQIMEILPHRYPFLFVDRVLEKTETTIKAMKCVTINEPFFQGHFPSYPIMPGVLLLEGLAQTAGLMLIDCDQSSSNGTRELPLYLGIEKARFKEPVYPGDIIIYEITGIQRRGKISIVDGQIEKEGKKGLVVTAQLILGAKEL